VSHGVEGTKKLLLMPRSHLKSTIVSQLYVLWRIYRNPNIRIFLDCNSLSLSRKHMRVLDTYLRDVELQRTVWNSRPHILGKLVPDLELSGVRASRQGGEYGKDMDEGVIRKIIWNAFSKQVIRPNTDLGEPTITAGSLGSAVTGQHYDLYIPDDLVDRKNSRTENLREKIEEHLAEIESVLDPWNEKEQFGQEIMMLGTRYYRDDAYGVRLKETKEKGGEWEVFQRNIYANGVDYAEGTLWPERFTQTYLTRKKNTYFRLGKSKEWFSQYLNQIIDDEKAFFRTSEFRYFDPRALVKSVRGWELKRTGNNPNIWLRPVMCVDWAFTAKTTSDFNAVVVIAMDPQGRVFVLDSYIKKCLPSDLYPHMLKMADYWGVVTIGVESIRAWEAIQGFRKYMLDKRMNTGKIWPLVEIGTKGEKHAKIITTLTPYYKSGRIIHNKTLHQGVLEDQLCHFPNDKDDGPDCLAMAVQLALRPKKHRPNSGVPKAKSLVQAIVGGVR
jgi:predicted phage terminase large subunit-like protein